MRLILVLPVLLFGCMALASARPAMVIWKHSPESIDPRYSQTAADRNLLELLHCSLYRFSAAGNLVGEVAAGPPRWKNDRELVVPVRPDFHFHNGRQLTAATIAANYRWYAKHRQGPWRDSPAPDIRAVKGAIHFRLKTPDADLPAHLTRGILTRAQVEGPRLERAGELINCGPFTISAWTGDKMHLLRNTWYGKAMPAASQNIRILFAESGSRLRKILAGGEWDLLQNFPPRAGRLLPSELAAGRRVFQRDTYATTGLIFNLADKTTGDPGVRRAIAGSLDPAAIISSTLGNKAIRAHSFLPPGIAHQEQKKKKDAKAVRPAGFRAKIKGKNLALLTRANPDAVRVGRALAVQLKRGGFTPRIITATPAEFLSRLSGKRFQLALHDWQQIRVPSHMAEVLASTNQPPAGTNYAGFNHPETDTLLAKLMLPGSTGVRRKLQEKLEQNVRDFRPYIWLWHSKNTAFIHNNLKGYTLFGDGSFRGLIRLDHN